MSLSLDNIVNISVVPETVGFGEYNTSNVAIFTGETAAPSFGDKRYKIYLSPREVETDFGSESVVHGMAQRIFSQRPNIRAGEGYLTVIKLETDEPHQAITNTTGMIEYFGIMFARQLTDAEIEAAAQVVQTTNKLLIVSSNNSDSIEEVNGIFDKIRLAGQDKTRCLYYGSAQPEDAIYFSAAYLGRLLSVNFNGISTTTTPHLKDLIGVQPDPTITQSILETAQAAGADVYAAFSGVPKIFSSGANQFFDYVYNLTWFAGALEIAGLNILSRAATKIPQTEGGLDVIKGAYRRICEQAVDNAFLAPGTWNSTVTFGVQDDLLRNIEEFGYYIYARPVAEQSQAEREERKAPLIQIAVKTAGAYHFSEVQVNVNI